MLYGRRVTIEQWWFDGRCFIGKPSYGDLFGEAADHFLGQALSTWRKLNTESRELLSRILWMHLRTKAYQWHFDQFNCAYMALDGIYKLASSERWIQESPSHKGRIVSLIKGLGLTEDEMRQKQIVRLRNNLVHEVKWDNGRPGTAMGYEGLEAAQWLPKLNQRLLISLLGYRNKWVASPWWTLGTCFFDRIA